MPLQPLYKQNVTLRPAAQITWTDSQPSSAACLEPPIGANLFLQTIQTTTLTLLVRFQQVCASPSSALGQKAQ